MSFKVGAKCKLYYNAGTHESPDWEEIAKVGDVMINDAAVKDDASTRESMINKTAVTGFEISVDANIVWDPANGAVVAVRNAYEAGGTDAGTIELFIADGEYDAAGTTYLTGPFAVTKFPKDQGLRKLTRCAVTFEPTLAEYEPEWGVVAGS